MVHGSKQAEQSAAMWERVPGETVFRIIRENMTRMVKEHPEAAEQIVPACPEWTARDLLAHVIEHCRSGRGPQPARSVDELSIPELLDEWAQTGPQVEERMAAGGGSGNAIFIMDTFTHELDLRRLVEEPVPADHPAFPTALGVLLAGFSGSIQGRGLEALRIETDGAQWTVGWGSPAATLSANRFDLYRSLAGRRTHRQISELSWSAPAQRWLPAFTWGPFHPPAQPTEEPIGIGAVPR